MKNQLSISKNIKTGWYPWVGMHVCAHLRIGPTRNNQSS